MDISVKAIADKRIFCLYAALNATGYDFEIHPPMHPIRCRVRDYIKGLQPDLANLEQLSSQYSSNYYYSLRTWILHHGEPPTFPEINSAWRSKIDLGVGILGVLLGDFWTQNNLETIWKEVAPEYQKILPDLEKSGYEATDKVVHYLRMNSCGLENLIIIPNFLDSYNQGLGPKINRTAYVILGPDVRGFSVTRIEHELLHSIINPLTDGFTGEQQEKTRLREYLIRSIVLRMNKTSESGYDKAKQQLIEKGYANVEYFLQQLAAFESSGQAFNQYLTDWQNRGIVID